MIFFPILRFYMKLVKLNFFRLIILEPILCYLISAVVHPVIIIVYVEIDTLWGYHNAFFNEMEPNLYKNY